MTKYNTTRSRPATGRSFIASEQSPSTTTANGGAGFVRDSKSELFLSSVSAFAGENSFYESAAARDERTVALSREVAVADLDWTLRFVTWLRGTANIRTAALLVALEGAYGLNKAGVAGGRALVSAAMLRADEPGEALAYWTSRYGRTIPKSVKRGIADAAVRMYSEKSLGKYDTASHGFRFADVIELTHPKPKADWQGDLFKYALDVRRDSSIAVPASLSSLTSRRETLSLSPQELRAKVDAGETTGLTWEALSGAISGGMDAKAWESVIPTMGYMALIRNLRNFAQAGVRDDVLTSVAARLADADEVARSRQLPMRFLSAYNVMKGNLRFAYPLEQALNLSLTNVPSLRGRTLVLVDRSGSMFTAMSERSDLNRADTASIFGSALALRAENATLVQFGTSSQEVPFRRDESILAIQARYGSLGGTSTSEAVRRHFSSHDRVIILTDEQANYSYYGDPTTQVPDTTPVYTWNLAGYRVGHGAAKPNRHYFGGLSDASFGLIELVERGRNADWPF